MKMHAHSTHSYNERNTSMWLLNADCGRVLAFYCACGAFVVWIVSVCVYVWNENESITQLIRYITKTKTRVR